MRRSPLRLTLTAAASAALLATAGCGSDAPAGDGAASSSSGAASSGAATSGAESSAPAPATSSAAEEGAVELGAPPKALGPWNGEKLPTLSKSFADLTLPTKIGDREKTPGSTGDTVRYQRRGGGGSISSIIHSKQDIDFHMKATTNQVRYDGFICADPPQWGGGKACYVGLEDGTLQFQASAGPNNTIEESAAVAAAVLKFIGS